MRSSFSAFAFQTTLPLFKVPRENFQITEFSRVGVDDRLEHLRCERSGRIGKDIHDLIYHKVGGERIHAFVRFGHIGDDFVQKIDDAAVLQSAARHDGIVFTDAMPRRIP